MAVGTQDFRSARDQWVVALDSDDQNCISKRLMWMTWHTATYRVINKARDLAPRVDAESVQLNSTVHEFIDHMFFENQMVVIRNLLDGGTLGGTRGVFSLNSVVSDMLRMRPAFTRAAIFDAEQRQYDCDASPLTGQRGEWLNSLRRHELVDWLTGVNASARQPTDIVRAEVLEYLRGSMNSECAAITSYVNQHIAHSATPGSRAGRSVDPITLEHIWKAQRIVLQYASFINVVLLGRNNMGGLPIPQYDHLLHFEKPWVSSSDLAVLDDEWSEYDDHVRELVNFSVHDLQAQMSGQIAPP